MRLTDAEQAMLDGKRGKARQKAMDLLVRYGEALGAERLVETNNVCGTFGATTPFVRDYAEGPGGMDAVFSEFNLDSAEVVEVPPFEVHTSHLQQGIDPVQADVQGVQPEIVRIFRKGEAWGARRGVQPLNTCTPYLVGNVPTRGEHCAWMESSAVIYINSVLGARTNHVPDLVPDIGRVLTEGGGMFAAQHGDIGVVVEIDQAAAPPGKHGLARGQNDPNGGLEALRPGDG